jgi:exodeoxyribonuclease V
MRDLFYIQQKLIENFSFKANQEQEGALKLLGKFISADSQHDYFILSGAAGTGKTCLVQALTEYFNQQETKFYLAAPTGRAAQILAKNTSCPAKTLHSLLFNVSCDEENLHIIFDPKTNSSHDDIRFFIIDEASMISDENISSNSHFVQSDTLLKQLIKYAKSGNRNNKIIFIGDHNQLPPVGSDFSPALLPAYLSEKFALKGVKCKLNIIERQNNDSYILSNAWKILEAMTGGKMPDQMKYRQTGNFSNSIKAFLSKVNGNPGNDAVMLAYANSQVNALNKWARIFRHGYRLSGKLIIPGERLISNQNTMLGNEVLYKGTSISVVRTWKPEEFAGLNFVNAHILFENLSGDTVQANTKILLDSLLSTDGNIAREDEKRLLHEAFRKNRNFRKTKLPINDAFVNAVRPRYGYALTCHKAQGGEWDHVFLHSGYRKENLRWLYTAMTRAKKDIYYIAGN